MGRSHQVDQIEICEWYAIDQHLAFSGLIEADKEIGKGAFAGTATSI